MSVLRCHHSPVVPAWLIAPQPPLRPWLGLLARMVLGAFVAAAAVTLLRFPLDPAAWSVIAVVVVIGFTAGASTVASINRMQGSIVGCLTGGITQMLLAGWLWLPFVAAISVGLSVTFCRLLRIGTGFRLGGALAGFFIFIPGEEEWATIGWRLAATLLGIATGAAIMLAWPARADRSVRVGIAENIRDCVLVIDAAIARWFGQVEVGEVDEARARLRSGTATVATALSDRAHERSGIWEPSTYSMLLADLNHAMLTALRTYKVGENRPTDSLQSHVREPFTAALEECRKVASQVADSLEAGTRVERKALLTASDDIDKIPQRIQDSLEELRAANATAGSSAEELQRLFGIALLLGHWSESVRDLARDLATS